MDVVYTFDNGYTDITMVSLISLLENNIGVEKLVIHVIDCGIDEKNQNRLKKLCDEFSRELFFHKGLDVKSRIPIELDKGYWSLVCYVRLFFADMLPDLDKVLHIDCDTIVCGNLQKLYDTELGANICAACYDCLPSPKYLAGFVKTDQYFSNGVLLFDLKKIREENIEEQFVQYIVNRKGILPHLDQDVISAVLQNKTVLLPPQYNLMTVTLFLEDKNEELFKNHGPFYSQDEIDKAIKEPMILHLVGYKYYSRPWDQPCYHPYNKVWLDYYNRIEGTDIRSLHKKKRKYGILNYIVCWVWNIGGKIKLINSLEKAIELRRFWKKCKV